MECLQLQLCATLRGVLSGRLPTRYRGIEHVSIRVNPRPAQSRLFCMLVLQLHAALQPPVGDKGRRECSSDSKSRDYNGGCAHARSLRRLALEAHKRYQRNWQDRLATDPARSRSISRSVARPGNPPTPASSPAAPAGGSSGSDHNAVRREVSATIMQ